MNFKYIKKQNEFVKVYMYLILLISDCFDYEDCISWYRNKPWKQGNKPGESGCRNLRIYWAGFKVFSSLRD